MLILKNRVDSNQFRGVLMNGLPKVEDVAEKNIFIYDIEIEDVDFVGELARRKIGKYENRIKLLRYNNHIIHVKNIDNFFKCFRCPTSDAHLSIYLKNSTSIYYDAKTESKHSP